MSLLMDALKKAELAKAQAGQVVDAVDEPSEKDGNAASNTKNETSQVHPIRPVVDEAPDSSIESTEYQQPKGEEELQFTIENVELAVAISKELGYNSDVKKDASAATEIPVLESVHESVADLNKQENHTSILATPSTEAVPERTVVRKQTPVSIGRPRVNRTYLWAGMSLLLFCAGLMYFYLTINYVERATAAYQDNATNAGFSEADIVSESQDQTPVVQISKLETVPVPVPVPTAVVVSSQLNNATTDNAQVKTASMNSVKPKPSIQKESISQSVQVKKSVADDPLQVMLQEAYKHYQTGDLAGAETFYHQVLQREADNRDALLGLAIIAQRDNRLENARILYRHVLTLNPKDSVAASALLSLNESSITTQNISQIKLMLQEEPTAAHLYFSLANEYAMQSRWPEAQQSYFQAYHYAPDNADYAFNLAVSLDKIGQQKNALNYYRQALQVDTKSSVSFDRQRVIQRIDTLLTITSNN